MFTNDTPITRPQDDYFGIDPFARALAKAISAMNAPEGVVIGINGPWGSGKSSAINLILYHLREAIESGALKIVRFSPWWLSGTEAIATAFLEDLLTAIGPSAGATALKLFRKVAQRISGLGKIVEAGGNFALPGTGPIASGALQALEKILPGEEGIEAQHKKVSELLANSHHRYLVIIDDIDRLGPDDAIEVFRLVKSVGQLSNVVYLLSFDRELAEKVVAVRFPSEGPHYLEKILQAAFEVPPATQDQLRSAFLGQVQEACPPKESEDQLRFMNVMLDGVTPLLNSPRDLNRLIGMLRVTWVAVADEVERADFIAMEALRLFRPDIYRAIRANRDRLTGYMPISMGSNTRDLAPEYDDIFLSSTPEKDRERVRRTLRRLFPKLDAIWVNTYHQRDRLPQRFRRVCSPDHFDTYFRFAIGEDVLPASAITAFVTRAGNKDFVQNSLREAVMVRLQSGNTRASTHLEQIRVHADRIGKEDVVVFLQALFEIGDDIDVEEDEASGFSFGDNSLRLCFLAHALLAERFAQAERSSIITAAIETAQLYILVRFSEWCRSQHEKPSYDQPLIDAATSEKLTALARERLQAAARDRTLVTHRRLFALLWAWTRTIEHGIEEVKEAVKELVSNDQFILHFASSAAGRSWSLSQGFDGMGDLVSRGRLQIHRSAVSPLIDVPILLSRLAEIAVNTKSEAGFVAAFMHAWENSDDREMGLETQTEPSAATEPADQLTVAGPPVEGQPEQE